MRICLTGANGAPGRVVHAALLEASDEVAGLAGVLPAENAKGVAPYR